jgi:hypothetical protein
MSWSVHVYNEPAASAKEKVADTYGAPNGIIDYIHAGIDALVQANGEDVLVNVNGSGHLFTGEEGNYNVTSAAIEVKLA